MPTSTPEGHTVIEEGQAKILFGDQNQVFYNKVQVLNRDLSIAVISYFSDLVRQERREKLVKKALRKAKAKARDNGEEDPDSITEDKLDANEINVPGIKIFEALSATGLRSIRYKQEIPNVQSILVNDLDPAAVEAIRRNIEFNDMSTDQLIPNKGDASLVMYQHRAPGKLFDVVDLDPYGSAATFLDSAVQAVESGGLMCVTCTDMAVLSGNNPEVCYAKYGSMPNKSHYLHEMSLRILLHLIETTANRYGRHIVPIISCSIDFYIRVFVRVYKSAEAVKKSAIKRSHVLQCCGCDSFHLQPVARLNKKNNLTAALGPVVGEKCDQCGNSFKIAGPIWSDPLHDSEAVAEILKRVDESEDGKIPTKPRLKGLLTTVAEELNDSPLYYSLPAICKTLHCSSPPMDQLKGAIINAGYKVSFSHKVPDAIKTDAPNDVFWDIFRCWVKKHPISKKRAGADTAGNKILEKEPTLEANFTVPAAVRNKVKTLRFPKNPEPHWGPKSRAVGNKSSRNDAEQAEEEAKRVKHE